MIIADLHIHSKYSRATGRECVPEYLDLWARRKGISLLGTGDFTHPAWRDELSEKLIPAEEGLYRLRDPLRLPDEMAGAADAPRFVVSGEISSIYKKNDKTRKVHNVILLPSLEIADELSARLEAIGNIHSDGRPILGLDSHDLLEITLETCPDAIFIPAHIWTPHFSLFGAFSGFDTIEECFEDLTPYIHAVETGLSSDPPMNWRLSALDRFTLVSNSDAHSPQKLGREANLLDIDLSYPALARALGPEAEGFCGTIEFFPEEGKYHYDGHRNCNLCLTPGEADKLGGRCPVCGRKLTIGVQHRVEQLADRTEGFRSSTARPFESLVPLPEVIAASTGNSATGKKVGQIVETLRKRFGAEFTILRQTPPEDIGSIAGPCVEEGIRRLRSGRVERSPGFDGEYGTIRLLNQSEIDALSGQTCLFTHPLPETEASVHIHKALEPLTLAMAETGEEIQPALTPKQELSSPPPSNLDGLNPEQLDAVTATDWGVSVIAGPGTGKTRTLVARIAYLVDTCGVKPSEIAAVTFTNKAAGEMRERLEKQLGGKRRLRGMTVGTFHSICLDMLSRQEDYATLIDEYDALEIAGEVVQTLGLKTTPKNLLQAISKQKAGLTVDPDQLPADAFAAYNDRLRDRRAMDFDDLLLRVLTLSQDGKIGFTYLLVDEFQDINPIQYQLVKSWSQSAKGLFVIGDPDQSIYGFRGSDAQCFDRLLASSSDEHPIREIRLLVNYRSTPEIIGAALPVINRNAGGIRRLEPYRKPGDKIRQVIAPSELSEAIYIAKGINQLVGGVDMLDAAFYAPGMEIDHPREFGDIAILYRTHRQAAMLEKCLRQESIPYVVTGREDYLGDDLVRGVLGFCRFLTSPQDTAALENALRLCFHVPNDLVQRLSQQVAGLQLTSAKEDALTSLLAGYQDIAHLHLFIELTEKLAPRIGREKPRKLLNDLIQALDLSESDPLRRLVQASVYHKDLSSFLQAVLLGQESDLSRSDKASYNAGAVTLMTLHGSKGLEFPVVFLCGVNQGTIPHESLNRPADLPEERRLFYVGMTRAKDELILLTSQNPSSFLADIPAQYLQKSQTGGGKQPSGGKQLSLFH